MPSKIQNLAAKLFRGLTQNSTQKLKVEINTTTLILKISWKKYLNPIEF